MPERESLIARIRQLRRSAEPVQRPVDPGGPSADRALIDGLEARIDHLEHMVQGLQDSVHREATRQEKRMAEVESRIEPGELGRALSEDARERGL